MAEPISVKEFTDIVESALTDTPALNNIAVVGEVSGFKLQVKSAYMDWIFFTLTDEDGKDSAVQCAVFKSRAYLTYLPKDGDKVLVKGSISLSRKRGSYSFKCEDILPYGAGERAAALEALKKKLDAEGIFAQKRPLPKYPKKIAVITSETGAVWHDICDKSEKRYPLVTLTLVPATVQGDSAAASVASAVFRAQNIGADLIIIARGGGSAEDLDCFNSEELARAVYASKIPTISAVGHETDFTICDFAADVRASTPTSAAEIALPDINEIRGVLNGFRVIARQNAFRVVDNREKTLAVIEKTVRINSPRMKIAAWEQSLERVSSALSTNIHKRLDNADNALKRAAQSISDLNPMAVLARGYSAVTMNERIIKSVDEVEIGDKITVKMSDGGVSAVVENIERDEK